MSKVIKKYTYLKLGEHPEVRTFHDPETGLSISNKMVVRVHDPKFASRKTIKEALSSNHLAIATQEEYEEYQEQYKKDVKKSQKNLKVREMVKIVPAVEEPEEDETEEESEELDEDETRNDDDDDEEELTKSELVDLLKESPLIKDEEKKTLSKQTPKVLLDLWKKVKPK
jgi:hypothetical protein